MIGVDSYNHLIFLLDFAADFFISLVATMEAITLSAVSRIYACTKTQGLCVPVNSEHVPRNKYNAKFRKYFSTTHHE